MAKFTDILDLSMDVTPGSYADHELLANFGARCDDTEGYAILDRYLLSY